MKSSRLLKSLKLRGVYYLCTVKTKINTPLMYEVLDKDTIKSEILRKHPKFAVLILHKKALI